MLNLAVRTVATEPYGVKRMLNCYIAVSKHASVPISLSAYKQAVIAIHFASAMHMWEGTEVQLHSFLTLALDGALGSASRPDRFAPGKAARCTDLTGQRVGSSGSDGDSKQGKCLSCSGMRHAIARLKA
jgi:hypothetical protein